MVEMMMMVWCVAGVALPGGRGGVSAGSQARQQVWWRATRVEHRSNKPTSRKL